MAEGSRVAGGVLKKHNKKIRKIKDKNTLHLAIYLNTLTDLFFNLTAFKRKCYKFLLKSIYILPGEPDKPSI